jgi:SAM-dependent methyltransferase
MEEKNDGAVAGVFSNIPGSGREKDLLSMQDGDLECPRCGGNLRALACTQCGGRWEPVLGVPFIGDFEAADALGLIEIAANAPNRAGLAYPPGTVERVDALCAAYHAAADKAAFKAAHEEARAFYFENRYHEWAAIETLLEDHDVAGRKVLDIGAGSGFDAKRLALRGARVTALEFSPLLAEAGLRSFPDLRWIGGFSHALPFADASFDFVFINAALHHMRDIPASIAEALRVLRPGGTLITSGDPFRSDAAGPELEFEVFDRHEAVLLGINEQIPPLSDILLTLERNRDILVTGIFTQMLHGGRTGSGQDLTEWTAWELDRDAPLLRQRSGGLAMRVRLLEPWPHPRAVQRDGILPPATFAAWLADPEGAIANLARIVPRGFVDRPFPGPPAKFDLINGWRVARSTTTMRTGFRRARLFRTRHPGEQRLHYEIRARSPGTFAFKVNARRVGTAEVGPAWTRIEIEVGSVPAGDVFLLEFAREGETSGFEEACFDVRLPAAWPRLADIAAAARPAALRRRIARYVNDMRQVRHNS